MSSNIIQLLWDSFLETILMVGISGGLGAAIGIPLGVFLFILIAILRIILHVFYIRVKCFCIFYKKRLNKQHELIFTLFI